MSADYPYARFIFGIRHLSIDGVAVIAIVEHINGRYFFGTHQVFDAAQFDEERSKRIAEQRAYMALEDFQKALEFQYRYDIDQAGGHLPGLTPDPKEETPN